MVLFSDVGAHREIILRIVFSLYLSIYLRSRIKPARSPYTISVNCSKSGSVGLVTSPSHALPIRILSGLLFRIPRGTFPAMSVEVGIKFLYVVLESEDAPCKQESLTDIEEQACGYVFDVKDLKSHKANAAED